MVTSPCADGQAHAEVTNLCRVPHPQAHGEEAVLLRVLRPQVHGEEAIRATAAGCRPSAHFISPCAARTQGEGVRRVPDVWRTAKKCSPSGLVAVRGSPCAAHSKYFAVCNTVFAVCSRHTANDRIPVVILCYHQWPPLRYAQIVNLFAE
jgi:hypothetical protein